MKILERLQNLPKRQIYMDYAAKAPMLRSAARIAYEVERYVSGNPSSIHSMGVVAHRLVVDARVGIAKVLTAHPDEIVFAGSGTESDNLAIHGVVAHARTLPAFAGRTPHIVTTSIEHPAVLETCRALEREGVSVTYITPNALGLIDSKDVGAALRPETVLVTIGYVNSEIGTIQPIVTIAKEIRHYKKTVAHDSSSYPLFHTDACQALAYLNINVEQLGVDLLTGNGTKIGGPSGVGLLFVRRGVMLAPLVFGGGQENGLRSGTENVPGVVAFAHALRTAIDEREEEVERLTKLRRVFISKLKRHFKEVRINGDEELRLPNNVHISFPNISSELLVLELDAKNICASAGSACSSAKDTGSHVVAALYGKNDYLSNGSVRFSMGTTSGSRDVDAVISALTHITKKYKKFS